MSLITFCHYHSAFFLCSCSLYSTANPKNSVLLRRWFGAMTTPETVPAMLKKMTKRNKDRVALGLPIVDNKPELINSKSWTYTQYYDDCVTAAKGFLKVTPSRL